jgi:biopolymer transport protein ExbB/TolQ
VNVLSAVATYFKTGGPFMYVILGIGVVALAIVLERLWVVGRAAALDTRKLTRELEALVGKGDVVGAAQLCRRIHSPTARVAHAILEQGVAEEAAIRAAADDAAAVVLPPLARRLPHLNLLANVATLLGLLGTIFGLTTAFSAVGAADPSQRSVFLAAGISQALNTTSLGLIIAVPLMIAHGFLVSRVEGVADQVDEITVSLIRALGRRGRVREAA